MTTIARIKKPYVAPVLDKREKLSDFTAGNAPTSGVVQFGSDRRLKTDIVAVGALENGLGLYEYRYLWDARRHIGVMADEVERIMPAAVTTLHGYKLVNYAMLGL